MSNNKLADMEFIKEFRKTLDRRYVRNTHTRIWGNMNTEITQ